MPQSFNVPLLGKRPEVIRHATRTGAAYPSCGVLADGMGNIHVVSEGGLTVIQIAALHMAAALVRQTYSPDDQELPSLAVDLAERVMRRCFEREHELMIEMQAELQRQAQQNGGGA